MPVAQTDIPATVLGYFGVVGDKYNRTSFGMQFLEENQYLKRSTCIQITRCFIGKDYRRVVHQGTGDGYTLHLSTGHLVRLMFQAVAESHCLQGFDGALPAFGC